MESWVMKNKKGDKMGFVTLDDRSGRIEASLENGERLVVSRHYAPLLRERLGL